MSPVTLDQLADGQCAFVDALTTRGEERRRLMDLGFVPGARVCREMRSPLGDPVAYQVMDTIVALRRSQAQEIQIRLDPGEKR